MNAAVMVDGEWSVGPFEKLLSRAQKDCSHALTIKTRGGAMCTRCRKPLVEPQQKPQPKGA